jgi:hypothetical protein
VVVGWFSFGLLAVKAARTTTAAATGLSPGGESRAGGRTATLTPYPAPLPPALPTNAGDTQA